MVCEMIGKGNGILIYMLFSELALYRTLFSNICVILMEEDKIVFVQDVINFFYL